MNEEFLVTTFTEMRKGFLRLASRFLPNEEDASDALQDAFCKLWPKRNQIHSPKEAEALWPKSAEGILQGIARIFFIWKKAGGQP